MKKTSPPEIAKRRDHSWDAATRCLETLQKGKTDDLFGILPQIGVLRDRRFLQPLLQLLADKSVRKREFAAIALGAMKEPSVVNPLFDCLRRSVNRASQNDRMLRSTIIHALGEAGTDLAAVRLKTLLPGGLFCLKSPAELTRVVESLGMIAQQGSTQALNNLLELASGQRASLCAQAIHEIAIAFWHRPNNLPRRVLQLFLDRVQDEELLVREAALEALEHLALLGSRAAEKALSGR